MYPYVTSLYIVEDYHSMSALVFRPDFLLVSNSISLYQNFEEKRRFKPPTAIFTSFQGTVPVQVSDLYWLSTFEFAIVYTPHNQNEKMSWFVFMNTPVNLSKNDVKVCQSQMGIGVPHYIFFCQYYYTYYSIVTVYLNEVLQSQY